MINKAASYAYYGALNCFHAIKKPSEGLEKIKKIDGMIGIKIAGTALLVGIAAKIAFGYLVAMILAFVAGGIVFGHETRNKTETVVEAAGMQKDKLGQEAAGAGEKCLDGIIAALNRLKDCCHARAQQG